MAAVWCKESYEKSVTGHAWAGTPHDAGWEEIQGYPELRVIFEEEMALGAAPNWAAEIVDRMIGPLPLCGHYSFPRPLLQICEAIGEERCPEFVCGCYTADSQRKLLMSYYVYCLDAWLKSAPLEIATAELAMRESLGKDWPKIITAIYSSLGEPSEQKMLLVRRLIHRLRWWIKTLIWFDDKRGRYMLDVYSGDVRGDEANWSAYGNSPFGDPFFAERELPEIKRLAGQICEMVPGGDGLLFSIEHSWLCGPKAFRYLEKIILKTGSIGLGDVPGNDISILQCEDTYPDLASYRRWYSVFMSSLTEWLEGDREALSELGDTTPAKHWLARILRHKLQLHERYNTFGRLIGAGPSGKSGTRTIWRGNDRQTERARGFG